MNMTREDMMRELELLPVWQLKQPLPTMPLAIKPVPIAVEPMALLAEPIVAATLLTAQPVTTQPAAVASEGLESEVEEVMPPQLLTAEPLPVTAEVMATPARAPEPIEVIEKIATPWLLCCPLATAHTEAQALLHNMIKAMHLLSTDVVVLTDVDKLDHYLAKTVVLFGLTAAQQYLKVQADNIEAMRGKLHQYNGACWVTYHPEDLLQNPSLKRAAWQDLCAALAHHAAA